MRPGIYSRWILILVVVGVGVAIVWAQYGKGEQIPVMIAKSDLTAYQVIAADDIRLGILNTRHKDRYAPAPVAGQVTLQAIKKDAPITKEAVGPDPVKMLKSKVIVMGVNVTSAALLGGAVQGGDLVRLVATDKRGRTTRLDVVVLSAGKGSAGAKDWTLVAALKADDARRYGPSLATADIVILRDPETPAPG